MTHAGNHPFDFHGFVNPPVVHASTVLYPDYATMRDRTQRYTYGTRGTPNTDALEEALNLLENSEGTIIVPSGLAAISIPLLAFAKTGDHILVLDSCYGPTREFCNNMLPDLGVEVEYYDPLIGAGIADLIRDNTTIIFTESPGSNTFEMQDIPAICKAAKASGVLVMMDNTWATGVNFKPLDYGVDVSIHALTKYPGGHSDLVLGSVSANAEHTKRMRYIMGCMGICPSNDDCALVLRGLRTMMVRLAQHEKNTLKVALWLKSHSAVSKVLHPAMPDDPGHAIWKRDFKGSTSLFGFVLKDADIDQAAKFLDALDMIGRGYSWGGYESLAVIVNLSDRTIAKGSEGGTLIRLHVGLEDPMDVITDLQQAIEAAGLG